MPIYPLGKWSNSSLITRNGVTMSFCRLSQIPESPPERSSAFWVRIWFVSKRSRAMRCSDGDRSVRKVAL